MASSQTAHRRYWIFKESHENNFLNQSKLTSSHKKWITGLEPKVGPSDIVYFWREEDSSYFFGWGRIESTPTLLRAASQGGPQENGFVVMVNAHLFVSNPVTSAELNDDPLLHRLLNLREIRSDIVEISEEEAVALNRLLLAHGVKPLPEPSMDEREEDNDPASDTTLNELLKNYSGRLSPLTQAILKQSGQFANMRDRNRDRITTSCILFAAAELGRPTSNQVVENASEFTFNWLNESDSSSKQYQQAFSQFFEASDQRRKRGLAILTSNAKQVIDTASRVAAYVRKQTVTRKKEVIYARDLVGALLFAIAQNPRLGAAQRLAGVDFSEKLLREDYVNNFLDHEKNPDDDIAKWRTVLISLNLPSEAGPLKSLEMSLPSIDADTPSLKDDLNITAEVNGFANIIAARDVKTPLSIGLFGDWGSGKSTFMEQLEAAVNLISKSVREKKDEEETSFLGNIVQIKFNAWHYAEGNLWASLVSHIFENLSFSEAEEKEKAKNRQQLFLGKLVGTLAKQKAAEAEVRVKEANYETARIALDEAQRGRDETRLERRHLLTQGIWPIVKKILVGNPEAQQTLKDARDLLGKAGLTEEELKREIESSRTTVGRLQLHVTSLINDPRRGLILSGILAMTFLLPIILTFAVARWGDVWERVIASATPLITLIGGAFAWLRAKRKTVDSMVERLDAAGRQIDQMYAGAQAEFDLTLRNLDQQVADRQEEMDDAKQVVEDAKKERADILQTLNDMEPARVLENFVQERAASEDYRKLLGVVALIRRDFKRLSDMLREQGNNELREAVTEILKNDEMQRRAGESTAAEVGGKGAAMETGDNEPAVSEPDKQLIEATLKEYRIDRIVLYIDDLDRCPPKQVVDVLQAIHLLLAFELFVVVVGVDARWIRHALREKYPTMLSEDWDGGDPRKKDEDRLPNMATPRDYVEKIFQVPFWLKPMDDGTSRKLFERLIPRNQLLSESEVGGNGNAASQDGVAGSRRQTPEGSGSADFQPGVDRTDQNDVAGTASLGTPDQKGTAPTSTDVSVTSGEPHKPKPLILKPESLLLDVRERDTMIALSRVIGRTPRTLKRFVNVYRIIKAGLDGPQLENFMGSGPSSGQYTAVLVLLSIAHGAPDLAPVLFMELKHKHEEKLPKKTKGIGFKTFLNQIAIPPATLEESLRDRWSSLITELQRVVKDADDIPLAVLREWLPVVVRYTFQLGRLSEEVANPTAVRDHLTPGTRHA